MIKSILPFILAASILLLPGLARVQAADETPASGAPAGLASIPATPAVVLSDFGSVGAWQAAATETVGTGAQATIKGAGLSTHPRPAASGGAPGPTQSLKVDLNLPATAGVRLAPDAAWNELAAVQFSVYLPPDAPSSVSLGTYVKDNEWLWYQTFPLRASEGPNHQELTPGHWTNVTLDLRRSASGWTPGGHSKVWASSTRPLLEFGLLFYSRSPFHGTVEISPMQGWKSPALPAAGAAKADHVQLYPSEAVTQWHPVTVNLHLDRQYDNPFDPAVVDMEGHFTGPGGDVTIPGFAYQEYTLPPGKKEPVPQGALSWKVRFMPVAAGHYTYKVTLKDATGETTLTTGAFDCAAAQDRGFVRISDKDPRSFGFDDHSFYYPIGLNVRHAGDRDNVHEGLPAIQHYFDKMASVGLTWTRTWMSSWWLAIEWSHDYDARYHGVGRYNLSNAWLLDKTLDTADRDGLYVDLTLNNHGQFSRGSDPEWQYNPYSTANGGRLTNPAQFFTDPWAKQMFKQRLRYIVARWGYSPHIFAWELFNEVDLTEGYYNVTVNDWMSEMSDYLHSIDPYQHLVSTHVCWWQADRVLWNNPKLQFCQADGYVRWRRGLDTMASFTDRIWAYKESFNKPSYIVEFGYKQTTEDTDASPQFHPGIWSGFMSPFSADSMYWDWYLVEQRNFWPQYAALVKFARGEDRRGQNLQVSDSTVGSTEPLLAAGINNTNRAYVWVYHQERQNAWQDGAKTYDWVLNNAGKGTATPAEFKPITGAKLKLGGLQDGAYHVEFWDTWTGTVVGEATVKATAAQITVPLPAFKIDLALKIKRVQDSTVATLPQ